MTNSASQRLQVGDWTVDPALNELSAPGKTVKLEPKAMAVLVYLIKRPGQVVSRDELLSAAWSGLVVSDDALTQVVIKLRKALGEAYIQTIPKGGYRLVARVGAHGPKRRLLWKLGAAAIAGLLLLAGAVWLLTPGRDMPVTASVPAQPTVTIRPFEALGNDAQAVLLARGMTADLVTDLSKLSGLSVIAGTTVPVEAPPIRYVVSGSVQRIDDRLRLHVHLADAQTGKQLWSERFDRPVSGFFAIQEEVGPKILHVLPAKVSEAELRRVAQRHTRSLEAYEYFQRGQAALVVRQKADNEAARKMFQRAIALDGAFARAYAGLALTYAADYRNQWRPNGAAALERAFELARTAHEINPDIRETYWVLGFVHLEHRQHEQALQYLESSVRLYPSFADGYALMGGIKTYVGRPADTVPLLRTAMRLNPEGSYFYFLILGRAYLFLGDFEQARLNLEQALSRNPENLEARVYMAALQIMAGDKSAAAWEAEQIRALQPGFSIRRWLETYPMTDTSQNAKLLQALGELGL